MKRLVFIIIFLAIFFLWGSTTFCFADYPDIFIESKVDKLEATIGDPIRYTLKIVHLADLKVSLPGPGANLGSFEIRDYTLKGPEKISKNRVQLKSEYIIATYDTGDFTIPPLVIKYVDKKGIERTIKSEEIKIKIKSVKPENAKDIKDIKPQAEISPEISKYLWIVLIGIFIVLGIVCLLVYLSRRKAPREIIQTIQKDPDQIAYEKLELLKASKLLEEGKIKEYYSQASEIIREYLAKRFEIQALELPTQDILNCLKSEKINTEVLKKIESLLNECDLVKFAKYQPDSESCNTLLSKAKEIVDSTRIVKFVEPIVKK